MSADQAGLQPAARPPRRCRRRAIDPGSPRPGQVLGTFFAAGLLFIAAGALAGVAYALSGGERLQGLALHLLFLGGISQLVLGAGQFFVCAFLATDPPPRRLVHAQLHLLAILWRIRRFALAVPAPRPRRDRALTAAAATAIAALALSHAPGLAPLAAPAAALTLAVGAVLALRVLVLAFHAAAPTTVMRTFSVASVWTRRPRRVSGDVP